MVELLLFIILLVVVLGVPFWLGRMFGVPEPILALIAVVVLLVLVLGLAGSTDLNLSTR